MPVLTKRRKAVLSAFKAIERSTGVPASLSAVAQECGVSIATVHEHAQGLLEAGLMHRTRFGGSKRNPYYKYHVSPRCPTCGKKM